MLRFGHGMRRPSCAATAREAAGAGDLTLTARVQDLHDRCLRRLRAGSGRLLVDLTEVTHMDTKLLAALVALKREARAAGQELEVLCSEPVLQWLRVCRLESVLAA